MLVIANNWAIFVKLECLLLVKFNVDFEMLDPGPYWKCGSGSSSKEIDKIIK
jgi:hypothetical protein